MTSRVRTIATLAAFLAATVVGAGVARGQATVAEAGNSVGEWGSSTSTARRARLL